MTKPVMVRMEVPLVERAQEIADLRRMTLNKYIIKLVEADVEQFPAEDIAALRQIRNRLVTDPRATYTVGQMPKKSRIKTP